MTGKKKEQKKSYVEPKLTTQGTVQETTQTGRNSSQMPCIPILID